MSCRQQATVASSTSSPLTLPATVFLRPTVHYFFTMSHLFRCCSGTIKASNMKFYKKVAKEQCFSLISPSLFWFHWFGHYWSHCVLSDLVWKLKKVVADKATLNAYCELILWVRQLNFWYNTDYIPSFRSVSFYLIYSYICGFYK